jgi:hypothetical protein
MRTALMKGLIAGAAGTTALNAVTYADMALRGRPASDTPERAVASLAQRLGQDVPGEGPVREHRVSGLGALTGIATGLATGAVFGALAPAVRRLPFGLAAFAIGAVAMAGSDVPMTRLGLTDVGEWSPADWAADAVPHLFYGAAAALSLRALR